MTNIHLSCSAMLLSPIDSHIHNTPHVNAQTLLHSLCHTPAHDFMQHVHFLTTPSSQQYTCAPAHACTQTQPHLYTTYTLYTHTTTHMLTIANTQQYICAPAALTYILHIFRHIHTHTQVYTSTHIHPYTHIYLVYLADFCQISLKK